VRARSTTAHIDPFYWKVRLPASWAPAESGSMSVINLFCDNLRAYLDGGPLRNVIDWERGY
jgi:hypothetical protein